MARAASTVPCVIRAQRVDCIDSSWRAPRRAVSDSRRMAGVSTPQPPPNRGGPWPGSQAGRRARASASTYPGCRNPCIGPGHGSRGEGEPESPGRRDATAQLPRLRVAGETAGALPDASRPSREAAQPAGSIFSLLRQQRRLWSLAARGWEVRLRARHPTGNNYRLNYRAYRPTILSGARPNRRRIRDQTGAKGATEPAERARPNRRKTATKPAQICGPGIVENSPVKKRDQTGAAGGSADRKRERWRESATKPAQTEFR